MDEGSELLEKFLDGIQHSTSIYTLKLFEQDGRKELRINEKSAADLSFNFKLSEDFNYTGERNPFRGGVGGSTSTILQEIKLLHQRLDRQESEVIEETPEKKDLIGTIGDILRDPDQVNQWIGVINNFKHMFSGIPAMQPLPAIANVTHASEKISMNKNNLSAVPAATPGGSQKPTPDELADRLATAIDTLERCDPKIVEHLEKLASVAVQNPPLFKMLISNLETL